VGAMRRDLARQTARVATHLGLTDARTLRAAEALCPRNTEPAARALLTYALVISVLKSRAPALFTVGPHLHVDGACACQAWCKHATPSIRCAMQA